SGERRQLQAEAQDLQAVLDGIQTQIAALQDQIRENEAKQDELERSIAAVQADLAVQRDLLGQNVRAMYLEDNMTAFEMLASSKDLSEYVDKEQYRIS